MEDKEYLDFLQYLFNEYVAGKISRIQRYFGHPRYWDKYEWHRLEWHRLPQAMHIITYINRYCDTDEDIYTTFMLDKLREIVGYVKEGVSWSNILIKNSGFIYAIEDHFEHIVDGIKLEHFSEQEFEILKELGSFDPKVELSGIIHLLKVNKLKLSRSAKEVKISVQLKQTEEILFDSLLILREEEKKEEENKIPKTRPGLKWFKGLGQICQGALLTIADVSLAIGVLQFPVSPETKTWGAMVSTTTGIGMILSGVGDLPRL